MNSVSSKSLPRIESRFALSSTSSSALAVAAERWNVEKKRIELDEDIEKFYNVQVTKCLNIDKVANERITKLYNDIYYKVKWSNPPLPIPIQKLFTDYCKHLLTEGPKVKFPSLVDLKVWKKKIRGSIHEKNMGDVDKQCKALRDIVQKRDSDLIDTQATLLTTTEKKNVKKDGTLRWMMETNVGKKDEYFTIWYLAANGKVRELDVLLNAPSKQADINQRDPDFGLTPLHYACKSAKLSMVQYLMTHGADLNLRTPDGRTALHLAAAYSTKEVVLELLGACMDYDAVDNYGCTAMQMAVQNRNNRTMEVLSNWTKLTLLPEELIQLEHEQRQQQQQLSTRSLGMSSPQGNSLAIGFESVMSKLSPSRVVPASPALSMAASSALVQGSIFVDPNIPEEYQPISPETIKLMSPTLSLLTKRLNAYNMYFVRSEANYVPTEVLRSRDLSNISSMLHRSAAAAEAMARGSTEEASTYSIDPNEKEAEPVVFRERNLSLREPSELDANEYPDSVERFVYANATDSHYHGTERDPVPQDNSWSFVEGSPRSGLGNYAFRSVFNDEIINPDDIFRSGSSYLASDDFATLFNECLVEIRLVSKHYMLCVKENLIDEAMRSLRRRWLIAKRLWDLIVQEKLRRKHVEEAQRAQQEKDMELLLAQQESYQVTYNEQGEPIWHSAGLLEHSSSLQEGSSFEGHINSSQQVATHSQLLENSSELAIQPSPPRLLQQAHSNVSDRVSNRLDNGPSSPLTIQADFTDSYLDINPNITNAEEQEQEVGSCGSGESSQFTGPPPLDLERIARAYEEQWEADRLAELNPDIENQSSSTLRRPADYESVGVPIYKVKENVYWETESANQRLHAPPLSADTSSGLTSTEKAPVDTNNASTAPEAEKSGGEKSAVSNHTADVPTPSSPVAHESNAWDVIQKWRNVADARARRRPNFDIYYSTNDEVMSTSSLLTFSVTEAPSTGGHTVHSPNSHFSYSAPPSPSGSSMNSASIVYNQVQQYSYVSGPFKEKVRGNYIIKLGLDLVNVYIVRKEEGKALQILHECCVINEEVEVTQKIALLEKKTDLMLHIHDTLERTVQAIEASLKNDGTSSRPALKLNIPTVRVIPSVRTIMTERIQGMLAAAAWVEGDLTRRLQICAASGSSVHEVEGDSNVDYFAVVHALPSVDQHTHQDAAYSIVQNHHQQPHELLGESTSLRLDSASDVKAGISLDVSTSSLPFFHDAGVSFADPPDDRNALQDESLAAIAHIRQVQKSLLRQCATTSEQSVALHREHYKTNIAEPSTLAVALMQRARVAERDYNGAQAMELTEAAEVVAVRALGGGSQLAITIMLESLRLYVKYHLDSASDLQYINDRSYEINQYIKQFSFTDIALADKFTQKCFEYVSICTIAIKNQQDEAARAAAAAKLAAEREARRKILDAQASVRKPKTIN